MSSKKGDRIVRYLKEIFDGTHLDGKGIGLFQTGFSSVNLKDYTIHPVSLKYSRKKKLCTLLFNRGSGKDGKLYARASS